MKDSSTVITFVFIAFVMGILAGYKTHQCLFPPVIQGDTVTVIETKIIEKPVPVTSTRLIGVPVLAYFNDTTIVFERPENPKDSTTAVIPMEQKYYEGDNYRAWVSGYMPSLDRLEVDAPVKYIMKKPRKWNVSLSAGYGLGSQGLTPCVGVSVGYTLFSF